MKFSHEKCSVKFQVRFRAPIFVSQQEVPHQSENESLTACVLSRRKGRSQMVLCLGNMGMRGKSDLFATQSRG
jgi:hypothetical protein